MRLSRRRKKIRPRFWVVAGVLATALVLLSVFWLFPGLMPGESLPGQTETTADPPPPATPPIELSFLCVGDIMVHRPQIASQYDEASQSYNYDNNFEYVRPIIESVDLALGNVETTFAGGKPSGYPVFNAPDALAQAIRNAGFDVALTSNNHLFDTGLAGLKRTLQILRDTGLLTTGTRLPEEKNYLLTKVKGVPVGIVAYTYRTPSFNGYPTINSAVLSEEAASLINSFGFERFDEDMAEVAATIQAAKADGAGLIICYFHWGEEYQRSPNKWQMENAKQAADAGADIIFASHPHVLQPIDMISAADGRQVPVFYSLGNFLSNQRQETLGNRYTEQGMLGRVRLTYDPATGTISGLKADAMGSWVDKYRAGGKDVYAIVPLDQNYRQNQALATSGHLGRAAQAEQDIEQLIGTDYIWK
ncbi:MAG TPA: CapA family protein [Clostridiales bacterium]|nr:CapA family protein [Clostridiales bacterium]